MPTFFGNHAWKSSSESSSRSTSTNRLRKASIRPSTCPGENLAACAPTVTEKPTQPRAFETEEKSR